MGMFQPYFDVSYKQKIEIKQKKNHIPGYFLFLVEAVNVENREHLHLQDRCYVYYFLFYVALFKRIPYLYHPLPIVTKPRVH